MVNTRTIKKFVYDRFGNIIGEWILINGVWFFFGWGGVVFVKIVKFFWA